MSEARGGRMGGWMHGWMDGEGEKKNVLCNQDYKTVSS